MHLTLASPIMPMLSALFVKPCLLTKKNSSACTLCNRRKSLPNNFLQIDTNLNFALIQYITQFLQHLRNCRDYKGNSDFFIFQIQLQPHTVAASAFLPSWIQQSTKHCFLLSFFFFSLLSFFLCSLQLLFLFFLSLESLLSFPVFSL